MILRNGLISGKPALLTNTATATITAAQMNHQTHVLTAACDLTLPMATVGLDAIFYANSDFEFAVVPGTADYCILNGTTLKIAQGVVSDGKAFSCVRARCLVSGYWTMTTLRGTISANSIYTSTTESPRISSVATGAFLDNLSAGAMAVIAANALVQVDVYYGSTLLRGYTGSAAVGTGETVSANPHATFNFTSGWGAFNATVIDADSFSTTAVFGRIFKSTGYGSASLRKFSGTASASAGGAQIWVGNGPDQAVTADGTVKYATSVDPYTYVNGTASGATIDVTAISDQQVLTPSTSGFLVYSDRALSVQSPLVDTLTKNQSAYTVILSKPR